MPTTTRSALSCGCRNKAWPRRDVEQPDTMAQPRRIQQRTQCACLVRRSEALPYSDTLIFPASVFEITKRIGVKSFRSLTLPFPLRVGLSEY